MVKINATATRGYAQTNPCRILSLKFGTADASNKLMADEERER